MNAFYEKNIAIGSIALTDAIELLVTNVTFGI